MQITTQTIGLLLGGVLPAFLFGFSGALQKFTAREGVGIGPFLVGVGLTTVLVGGLFTAWERDATLNARGALYAFGFGAFWATGVGCTVLAIKRFQAPLSQLVPLYNMNTLVAVLIGLIVLSEWHSVHTGKLLVAALMIIVGGILAATS